MKKNNASDVESVANPGKLLIQKMKVFDYKMKYLAVETVSSSKDHLISR